MEIKAVLKIDLLGDPAPRQCRDFYQELAARNWLKVENEESKVLVIYENIISYEEALEKIKRELFESAKLSGITRYGTLVHFLGNNMVVFFCGKTEEKEK